MFLLILGIGIFLFFRAFIYFQRDSMIGAGAAFLGGLFMIVATFATVDNKVRELDRAQASAETESIAESGEAQNNEFSVEDLTLGQKLRLCGKKSFELGVEHAPRIDPDDQHKVTAFIKYGGCEQAYAEFDSGDSAESNGPEEAEFGEPSTDFSESIDQ